MWNEPTTGIIAGRSGRDGTARRRPPGDLPLRVPIALLGVAAALTLSACQNDATSAEAPPAPAPVTVTATVTPEPVTVTETATSTPTPTPTPSGPKREKTNPASGGLTIPDYTGENLQIAQDDLQQVTGDPFYVSFEEDATGADRLPMLDSGWMVCSQDPAPGSRFAPADDVTFFVVRVSERCP